MNTYFIDLGTNRITFPDSRFYIAEGGELVPSVTTILDAYPKSPGFYEWLKRTGDDADQARDEAGRRGSKVHELTEQFDEGYEVQLLNENGMPHCKMLEWAMFERYVEFRRRFNPTIEVIEQNMVSGDLGYAGTLDRILVLNGKRYIVDIKTSNAIHPHYWLQLAAYRELWREHHNDVDGVAVLWLNAKTKTDGRKDAIQGQGWQLVSKDDTSTDLILFDATRKLWQAENGSLKPREFVYSLTHKI